MKPYGVVVLLPGCGNLLFVDSTSYSDVDEEEFEYTLTTNKDECYPFASWEAAKDTYIKIRKTGVEAGFFFL